MRYRYSWSDPNTSPPSQRVAEGTSYQVDFTSFCVQDQRSIRVFDGASQVEWKCAIVSSLVITPLGSPRYDCINGSCLEKSKFGTPGIYESQADCEQNCGRGCGGVCISNADWGKIGNLAAMIKNKDCTNGISAGSNFKS